MLNIEKTRASPNHAQSNGEVERFNQVLGSMLRCYVSETQKDWDTYLPQLLLAYRSSEHSSTKRTPFFMMFGYEVPLPVDVMFGRPTGEPYQGANEWAADLRRRKEEAYADVRNNLSVPKKTESPLRPPCQAKLIQGWRPGLDVQSLTQDRSCNQTGQQVAGTLCHHQVYHRCCGQITESAEPEGQEG